MQGKTVCTGQELEVDMENDTLTDVASGRTYRLKPLGEVSITLVSQALACVLYHM